MNTFSLARGALLMFGVSAGGGMSAFAHDVTVNISGNVIAASCDVQSGETTRSVDLGTIVAQQYATTGLTGPASAASVDLNNCSNTSEVVTTFSGTADGHDNTLLGLTATGTQAGNLGVQILDVNSTPVSLGDTMSTTVSSDTATVAFKLRYKSTGAVTAGDANAVLYLDFAYQ